MYLFGGTNSGGEVVMIDLHKVRGEKSTWSDVTFRYPEVKIMYIVV